MGVLDWFRIAAAFLVTAIHISPLEDISAQGDLVLTRILARVAVPFFFMVTGYFVLDKEKPGRVRRAIVKNLKWYLLAVVIYLPINWYAGRLIGLDAGYVSQELLIQGTFYHLWYFPALITALALCGLAYGYLGLKPALGISILLYLFGLMGDSYYGLISKIPFFKTVYDGIFAVMENTRNGFFLAPLFLLLGAAFREWDLAGKEEQSRTYWGVGLAVSMVFMTAEGLLVHSVNWPHHDSMYLSLPVAMVFLFGLLLQFSVEARPALRRISLWIYLLHPAFIVVVRRFAKITKTEQLLVENHLVHFLCVALLSAVTAYVLILLENLVKEKWRAKKEEKSEEWDQDEDWEEDEESDWDQDEVWEEDEEPDGEQDQDEAWEEDEEPDQKQDQDEVWEEDEDMEADRDLAEKDEAKVLKRDGVSGQGRMYGKTSKYRGGEENMKPENGWKEKAKTDTERRQRQESSRRKEAAPQEDTFGKRAWLEIDRRAFSYNLDQFQRILSPGTKMMAVVKADAYGHGAVLSSRWLEKEGITAFAVATLPEGIELRRGGVEGDILILGYTNPADWPQVAAYDLIQTIVDENYAAAMDRYGQEETPLRAHLAIDSGMHRLGVAGNDYAAVQRILEMPGIRLEGMFSHLCAADSLSESDMAYTKQQIRQFELLRLGIERLYSQEGITEPLCFHLQNSYGFLNYPQLTYHYVRLGIILYGAYTSSSDQVRNRLELEPVMSVRARVAMVKLVEAGMELGYGRAYRVSSPRQIATVTIGYADGIPRNYGQNQSQVLIGGRRYPVVGRICMDQFLVDVTAASFETSGETGAARTAVQAGDVVTLIGRDGSEQITVEEVAGWCGTITNEILCRMGGRLEHLITG